MVSLNMKRICNLGLIIFATAQVLSANNTDSLTSSKGYMSLVNARVLLESGGSGMNQYMMNRLGFGGYMSGDKIENAEKYIHANNRFGFVAGFSLGAGIHSNTDTSSHVSNWVPNSVLVGQNTIVGGNYTLGAWQTVFRGNAPFLAKKLELGKTSFTQFQTREVTAGWDDVYKSSSKNVFVSVFLGVSQLLAYRNLNLESGSLYTDSTRNYVDAGYSAEYTNTGRDGLRGTGWGLKTGFNFVINAQKKPIVLAIYDLGFYQINGAQYLEKKMSGTVRIQQSEIGVQSLNSADWIEYLRDTVNASLAPDSTTVSKAILAPFYVYSSFHLGNFNMQLEYRYINGYLPRLSIVPHKSIQLFKGMGATPELQLGGFDTYNLNFKLQYYKNYGKPGNIRVVNIYAKIWGIEAFAFPQKTRGAGVSLGMSIARF